MPKALITGCAGQDGSYLAEILLAQGYDVDGLVRPSGDDRLQRLKHILLSDRFSLRCGDMMDESLPYLIAETGYDEVYHLAAVTQVHQSFDAPAYTMQVNAVATARLLEALKAVSPKTKLYFASTSETFGHMKPGEKANEDYPLGGRSPYAASKIAATVLCDVYRKMGMFVVTGVAFNHESPRRGEQFVTQRICKGLVRYMVTGEPLGLGRLDSWRDWHHAKDSMKGAYLAMQADNPDKYVFASGTSREVRFFLQRACECLHVNTQEAIAHSESQVRPWDVDYLQGDSSKAERVLGWNREYNFDALVEEMCDHALGELDGPS